MNEIKSEAGISPVLSTAGLGVSPSVRARTLLTLLWRKYDAGGTSMGRSYEAVLLEAAMDLLGPTDESDVSRLDAMQAGDLVNETRTYLSSLRARREGLVPNAGVTGSGEKI